MPSPPANAEAIGKYRVTNAANDMGGLGAQVFFAVEPDTPARERQFRIKLLDVQGLDRAKALRELRLVRRLKHEAIPPVVEYFEHGRQLAVVFETLDGLWLDQIFDHLERDDERLPLQAIWRIGLGICGALAAAHLLADAQGRVLHVGHSCLAPDQIHISWSGAVRVYGIGLRSVFADATRGGRSRLFFAPEYQPKGIAAGPRADVFGAGAILWALLSGEPPVPGESLAKIAELRADVPEPIASGINLAVERSVSARRISCQQLEERLGKALEGGSEPEELRRAMEVFRNTTAQAISDLPHIVVPSGEEDEQGIATTEVPRGDSEPDVDESDEQVERPPPAIPRPRSSAPTDGSGDQAETVPPVRAGQRRPGGTGARKDVHEQVTIPAAGSDPPEDDPPGLASKPPVRDDSVVKRISSLFDDIGALPKPKPGDDPPDGEAAKADPTKVPVPPAGTDDEAKSAATDSGAGADGVADLAWSEPEEETERPGASDSTATSSDSTATSSDTPGKLPDGAPGGERDQPLAVAVAADATAPTDEDRATTGDDEAQSAPPEGPEPALAEPAAAVPSGPPKAQPGKTDAKGRGVSPLMAVLLALIVGAAGFAAAWLLKPSGSTSLPTAPTATESAAVPSSSAPAPPPRAAPTATVDGGAADASAVEAAPDASVEPPVDDVAEPGGDGSELLSYEGYLTVKSRVTAEVYVQGIHLGPTNRKIKSRCRQRFIRLRDPASGQWLTKGDAVRIKCMGSTTATIDPPAP
jgi:hypothetical protein